MILPAEPEESSLAAKKKRQVGPSSIPTSTPKNRVWGFEKSPVGHRCSEVDLSWETAAGSVQFTYENVSGRAEFISRDPLSGAEFSQGSNLYAYCRNNFTNASDPTGMRCPWTGGFDYDTGDVTSLDFDLAHDVDNLIAGQIQTEEWEGNGIGDMTIGLYQVGMAAVGGGAGVLIDAEEDAGTLGLGAANTWGNAATLADHFDRHGGDFGSSTAEEYANQASSFFQSSQAEGLPTKIDSAGTIRTYDQESNTFGSFNADGTTKTFFKPSSSGYFDRQPGTLH